MPDINKYIEIPDSILSNEAEENTAEFKKLASILKIINVLKSKEKIDEADMIEFIYPFIGEGRENSLMRMNRTYESIDDVSGEKKN